MSTTYYPYWILLFAIVLFVLEVFIPSGGILGVLSAIAFVSAIVAAFAYGDLQTGTTFMAATAVLVPAMIYLLVKLWPVTYIGRRILIPLPKSGDVLPDRRRDRQQLVGKVGVAKTPMLPAGAISIDGKTFDAISDGMTIEKGSAVEVIALRNNALVVRPRAELAPPQDDRTSQLDSVIPDPFDDPLS